MTPQQSREVPTPATASAASPCAFDRQQTAPGSRADAHAAGAAGPPARAAGAPPCITAPANCIRPFRHGVDSLYLSFAGAIDPSLALELQECKEFAQASNEGIQALGWISLGEHKLATMPRGRGRFAFVLEDNWFSLQVSNASAGILPLALVQIRSEYLTAVGPEEAVRVASMLVDCLRKPDAATPEPPKVSRIDLFTDFGTDLDLAALPGSHWVKRSKKRSIHEECDQVTGISFGAGNEISARLYDKTRELLKSRKDYLKPLWSGNGWDGSEPVWRMEFQIRREGLPEQMKCPAPSALLLSADLWRYLCDDWLRLAIPSGSDDTRSRWPTHPLWQALAQVWDVDADRAPLTRVPKTRAPSDDYLFRAGIAGLTSFMAREGIGDYGHGLGEFLHALEAYYDDPARQFPEGLQDYIHRKTRAKARRYNVRMDGDED